jgi:hypothetical protein
MNLNLELDVVFFRVFSRGVSFYLQRFLMRQHNKNNSNNI